jgi:hypothetical protein
MLVSLRRAVRRPVKPIFQFDSKMGFPGLRTLQHKKWPIMWFMFFFPVTAGHQIDDKVDDFTTILSRPFYCWQ